MVSQETVSKFLVDFHRVNVDVLNVLTWAILFIVQWCWISPAAALFILLLVCLPLRLPIAATVPSVSQWPTMSMPSQWSFPELFGPELQPCRDSPKVTAKDLDFQRLENLQCWISWVFWGICDGWTDFFFVWFPFKSSWVSDCHVAMNKPWNHRSTTGESGTLAWKSLEHLGSSRSLLGISPCFRGFIEMTPTLYHVVSLIFQHTWFHGLKTTPDEASPEEHLVGFEPCTLIFGNGWTKHQELLGVLGTVFLVPYKVSIVTSHEFAS